MSILMVFVAIHAPCMYGAWCQVAALHRAEFGRIPAQTRKCCQLAAPAISRGLSEGCHIFLAGAWQPLRTHQKSDHPGTSFEGIYLSKVEYSDFGARYDHSDTMS
jgi:hypothetical protein